MAALWVLSLGSNKVLMKMGKVFVKSNIKDLTILYDTWYNAQHDVRYK
jgi:hypothetical protein